MDLGTLFIVYLFMFHFVERKPVEAIPFSRHFHQIPR